MRTERQRQKAVWNGFTPSGQITNRVVTINVSKTIYPNYGSDSKENSGFLRRLSFGVKRLQAFRAYNRDEFTNLMHKNGHNTNANRWLFNSCHLASLAHLVRTLRPQGNALVQFVHTFLTHRKSWVSSWLELPACLSDGSGDVGINYTESATFTIQMYSPEAKGDTR